MKSVLIALVLTMASFAQAEICFQMNPATGLRVPKVAPQLLCLEQLNVGSSQGSAQLKLDQASWISKELTITSFNRHNEERANFAAETELLPKWDDSSSCYINESLLVQLEGTLSTGSSAEIDPQQLKVSIVYHGITDTCHNPTYESTIDYKLVP